MWREERENCTLCVIRFCRGKLWNKMSSGTPVCVTHLPVTHLPECDVPLCPFHAWSVILPPPFFLISLCNLYTQCVPSTHDPEINSCVLHRLRQPDAPSP